jgi:hypothetical protein
MTPEKPLRKFRVGCVEEMRKMAIAPQRSVLRRRPRSDRNPAPQDLRASERLRAQRTPPPEDVALYRCQCGYAFKAEVTASVDCPHCGTGQAW